MTLANPFANLNEGQQSAAFAAADAPLLIIAGAGTGKTTTLAHRIAKLVADGADPRRILLLTFSRRAAQDMVRRAQRIVGTADLPWAGTFHAVGAKLLRLHAHALGLDPAFTVLDRADAADLLDLVRADGGFARKEATDRRFPRKDTCLAIYSRTVNARQPLEAVLAEAYPWCKDHAAALRALFGAYVEHKLARAVLDYDDLLLWWWHAMAAPEVAAAVRARFDHVLVDEYQDTNALQAEIVIALSPSGRGVTAVGDDAQAIYAFRAATVHNILEFPTKFETPARVVALEDNYRSTSPIVEAANAVIERSPQRHAKTLRARRSSQERPRLAIVEDELGEVDYVVEQILAYREAGIALRDQAVLVRAAHHADPLELELGRRKIPYVKYGGLKFLEAAHVKDLLSFLRWGENPSDPIAALRVLQLVPGIGPAFARKTLAVPLAELAGVRVPAAAREKQPRRGDRHVFAPRSRFLPDAILDRFERVVRGTSAAGFRAATPTGVVDVAARLRAMW